MDDFPFPLCISFFFFIFAISNASDSITTTQSIRDGETIVSSGGTFELGFFSPGKSKNRYVGIWFKKISSFTCVWVANREIPLTDTSGVLTVKKPGKLVLINGNNSIIWSTNYTSTSAQNPVAKLLESGNLVVRDFEDDDSTENFLWQSFDYPGNTLIPGMKFGKNLITGREWYLSSWKSDDDPSQGDFVEGLDPTGYPQAFLRNGNSEVYRTGPWVGTRFSGCPVLRATNTSYYEFVVNKEEVTFTVFIVNISIAFKRVLRPSGIMQRFSWEEEKNTWVLRSSTPADNCDLYASCGAYSSCKMDGSPVCGCLDKFTPSNPSDWNTGNWSSGCIRRTPLDCQTGDGFVKYSSLKLPDSRNSWNSVNMTLKECRTKCLGDCTCMAYSNLDIHGNGSGCLMWFGNLTNMKDLGDQGQDIYVRMALSEAEVKGLDENRKGKIVVGLTSTIGTVMLILSLAIYGWKNRRQLKETGIIGHVFRRKNTNQNEDLSLPMFDFSTIMKATSNFSKDNKLGEGGYGPVYKGILEGGQEIAVKRLSKDSNQGLDEFKNEVIFIAKLQHRNLVKLLGCCIQREEKMLIYEYMPNKSLDSIFDKTKSSILDWPMRFNIINGISRGLLYLHQDSRLRIIHRDLKTSNILLDNEMNPKISDFGMARSFGGNQTEANTCKVVGTYGYISPEYAIHGIFSVKSDVFSFGVLVLEIVSGKRNRGFSHPEHSLNLIGHAWILYKDERSLELVDNSIKGSCDTCEILRCIHVALLCVQQRREDRPSMGSVVQMMTSEAILPVPKQPGFFSGNDFLESEYSPYSLNEVTITSLEAR